MIQWFRSLDTREANAVLLGTLAVVAMVLYQFVWVPLDRGAVQRSESLAQRGAYLDDIRALSQRLAQARTRQDARPSTAADQSLLSVVDKSSKAFQLASQVKRIEPDGQARVRVWLEDAPFDVMLRWLVGLLSQYGVSVDNISVDPGKASGMIKARLILVR